MSSGPEGGVAAVAEDDLLSAEQLQAASDYAHTLLDADAGVEVADAAAQDAVAAFRQTLAARGERHDSPVSAAETETLLALTRLMSAVSVPDRSSPADRRQAVWASIGQSSHCTCRESAALLATRANGNIQPRENTALDEHLAGCEDCRAFAIRAADADAAFRAALEPPRRGGGLGLGSVPRGPAYGALGAVLAIVVAVVVLLSSGSGSDTSRAAVAPSHVAKPAASTASPAPHAAVRRPAKHHPAARPAHHPVHHPAHRTVPSVPASSAVDASSSGSSDASATGGASAVSDTASSDPASSTAAQSTQSAASQPATQSATPTHSATPSTASQVSGSSSLPADSAPQKGIGDLTSTTP